VPAAATHAIQQTDAFIVGVFVLAVRAGSYIYERYGG
jgi:hypothetical protein